MNSNDNKTYKDVFSNSEKIKIAAMKLFSIYGYGSTTVRMIAEEARLSPGQITVHFGSKEELYESIVNDAVGISNTAIASVWEKEISLSTMVYTQGSVPGN